MFDVLFSILNGQQEPEQVQTVEGSSLLVYGMVNRG